MSEGIVRSLGSGRFLDWKAVNAEGASGGILICWDRRSGHSRLGGGTFYAILQIPECRKWGCLGFYGSRERSSQRRISSAMRKFEIVDDLGLVDLPYRGENSLGMGAIIIRLGQDWTGIDVRGSASYKLAAKMKEIKQKLKVWNREVFGSWTATNPQPCSRWNSGIGRKVRILTVEKQSLKKRQKKIIKMGAYGGNSLETALKGNMVEGGG
ncbi:hypothetical protein CK203_116157 [Vitis vinifera]|uniref:Uncharacterized protein n=1 Tax=Vitis vinifera TaxID=29760 RepID=A0A438CYY1_VITVI|nr:hypothetical protein CK203_116157 [Vitis vinifera]